MSPLLALYWTGIGLCAVAVVVLFTQTWAATRRRRKIERRMRAR